MKQSTLSFFRPKNKVLAEDQKKENKEADDEKKEENIRTHEKEINAQDERSENKENLKTDDETAEMDDKEETAETSKETPSKSSIQIIESDEEKEEENKFINAIQSMQYNKKADRDAMKEKQKRQILESDDDGDNEWMSTVVTPATKKSKPSPKPSPKPPPSSGRSKTKSKPKKVGGLTVEQHRRKLGDAVKSRMSMEKYCMKADCHATVSLPVEMFRTIVVPHACSVTPKDFSSNTPVAVALVKGSQAAGEVFGKSKIKGGNRMETRSMEKAEVVYFPQREKARVWWVMYTQWGEDDDDEDEIDG